MTILIDRTVPIPTTRRIPKKSYQNRYPFDKMKIGDSFFIAVKKESEIHSIRTSAYLYSYRHENFRITTRTTKSGVRIWRVPSTYPRYKKGNGKA